MVHRRQIASTSTIIQLIVILSRAPLAAFAANEISGRIVGGSTARALSKVCLADKVNLHLAPPESAIVRSSSYHETILLAATGACNTAKI
jgi:hypothetical protein